MASKNPKSDSGGESASRATPPDTSSEPQAAPAESPKAATRADAAEPAPVTSPTDVASAYGEFMKRVAEANSAFEKQYNEQLAAYTTTLRETEQQIADAQSQAAQRYREQLQAAWDQGGLAGKVTEAYQRFVKLSEEHASQGNLQQALADAYASFLAGLTQAGTGPSAGSPEERHRSYLEAIQKAWDQTELHKRVLEAHAEYLLLLQQLQQQGWQQTREAQQAYETSVREVLSSTDLPKRASEALERSNEVLRQAWQQACKQYSEDSAQMIKMMQAASAMPSPFASPGQGASGSAGA